MAQSQSLRRARPAPRQPLLRRLFALALLSRQRRALARLDAALLKDIGLTQDEAAEEARRAIWDVPAHWRHPL
ncbi:MULTISPECIES: DUF1127 domain-containing protein [Gemmobacter]|uniref:Uncharacterized protein DUF1127 n=2 Tax=Gemmobacter TaxID=204456 RepID=A0A2T6B1C2_9RHOB|nr:MULTISPECIES: DUF1127 domain-containing protein [Gemmobacter]PTX49877.1 uncharacterized protein DUF1127 [Gemmobacter caeni]TWJ01773.1 uncharacterized protein DUF1127 [Gemmobacter caeni]GHC13706.1 hypothetical protein GCM10007291_09360 [Gemmobacter nanjingensis]